MTAPENLPVSDINVEAEPKPSVVAQLVYGIETRVDIPTIWEEGTEPYELTPEDALNFIYDGHLHPEDAVRIGETMDIYGITEDDLERPEMIAASRWDKMWGTEKFYFAVGLAPFEEEVERTVRRRGEDGNIHTITTTSIEQCTYASPLTSGYDRRPRYVLDPEESYLVHPISNINSRLVDERLRQITGNQRFTRYEDRWLRLTPSERADAWKLFQENQAQQQAEETAAAEPTEESLEAPAPVASTPEQSQPTGAKHRDPEGRAKNTRKYRPRHAKQTRLDRLKARMDVVSKLRGMELTRFLPHRAARQLGALAVTQTVAPEAPVFVGMETFLDDHTALIDPHSPQEVGSELAAQPAARPLPTQADADEYLRHILASTAA